MNLEHLDIELLAETVQFRLENDEELILQESLKDELETILMKLEDEYL